MARAQDKFGMWYDSQEQADAANAASAAQTVKTPAPAVDTAYALQGGTGGGNLVGSQADIDAYLGRRQFLPHHQIPRQTVARALRLLRCLSVELLPGLHQTPVGQMAASSIPLSHLGM